VFFAAGSCGWRANFDPDVTFEVAFRNHRFSTVDTDWVGARLSRASIDQSPLGKGMERIVISGKPVHVPQVWAKTTKEQASRQLLDLWYRAQRCDSLPPGVDCWGRAMRLLTNDGLSTELLLAFQSVALDRSAMSIPVWSAWTESADSIVAATNAMGRDCTSVRDGRLLGLVSTNSTLYTPGPPKLVKGVLQYEVAGLHYLDDNSLFRGTYDLVMDSDFVRCIYRLSKAPIYATVEVTSADGRDEQVVTTSVNEKRGMLHLRATGFTFSSPRISVRILGKSMHATTIQCKKGDRVKKVTAINPRCPKGWTRI
jgi:hypothetical protein